MIIYKITAYGYVDVYSDKGNNKPLRMLVVGKTHQGFYECFHDLNWHAFPSKQREVSNKELIRMALYIESKYPNWFGMAASQ